MDGDLTDDIQVGVREVSWLSRAERGTWRSRGKRGGTGQKNPSPPGRIETARLSVCEGYQVSTSPPYNQDRQRHWGGGVKGAREGPGNKTNPPPPTRTDNDSGAAVSGVGVARGKQTNWAELGRTDSWEKRRMRCW